MLRYYYIWGKPLYASVRLTPRNRLVSLFLTREVGRVSYGGNSVFVEFICSLVLNLCRNGVAILWYPRVVLLRSIIISGTNPCMHLFVSLQGIDWCLRFWIGRSVKLVMATIAFLCIWWSFICSLVLLSCRNGLARQFTFVISTSCSAEVNNYFCDKPLYTSVLVKVRNRLVSSFWVRRSGGWVIAATAFW